MSSGFEAAVDFEPDDFPGEALSTWALGAFAEADLVALTFGLTLLLAVPPFLADGFEDLLALALAGLLGAESLAADLAALDLAALDLAALDLAALGLPELAFTLSGADLSLALDEPDLAEPDLAEPGFAAVEDFAALDLAAAFPVPDLAAVLEFPLAEVPFVAVLAPAAFPALAVGLVALFVAALALVEERLLSLGSPVSDFFFVVLADLEAAVLEDLALGLAAEAFFDELDLLTRSDFLVATSVLSVLVQPASVLVPRLG